MDGGTVYNLDAEGAVRACLDGIVDDPSKIVMDIYICGADEAPKVIDSAAHTESNFLRAHQLRKYYDNTDSIAYFMQAYPEVEIRHLVLQTEGHMGGKHMLNFYGNYTQPAQDIGR